MEGLQVRPIVFPCVSKIILPGAKRLGYWERGYGQGYSGISSHGDKGIYGAWRGGL